MNKTMPNFSDIAKRFFGECKECKLSPSRRNELLALKLEGAFVSGFEHGEVSALKVGRRVFTTDGLQPER